MAHRLLLVARAPEAAVPARQALALAGLDVDTCGVADLRERLAAVPGFDLLIFVDIGPREARGLLRDLPPSLPALVWLGGAEGLAAPVEAALARADDVAEVVAALPDVLIRLDATGHIVDFRVPQGRQSFLPREEVLGRPLRDVLAPDVVEGLESAIARLRVTGQVQSFEYVLDARDPRGQSNREMRWFEARVAASKGGGVLVLERDVTDRVLADRAARQAIDALRASDERARLVFSTVPVALLFTEFHTASVLDVNPAAELTTGYSRDELRTLGAAVIWADSSDRARMLAGLRESGAVRDLSARMRRKSGEVFDTVVSSRMVSFQGQDLIIGVILDVTERNRAAEALARSEARYRTLVEHIPERIALKDRHLRYVSANSAHLRHLGVTAEEIEGKTDEDLLSPAEAARFSAAEQQVIDSGKAGEFREEFLEQGRRRSVRGLRVPVRDENGVVNGVLTTFSDVTEARMLEEQLRQAQKLEAVGTLAGGVAHDFNNHMTIVNGYCDLILEQLDADDPLRAQVSEIRAAGGRAADLTQQLLAFSRKQVTEPRLLDVNEIIRDLHKMLRRLIGERIELVSELADSRPAVRADRGQLQQVLMNLVVNARDAMPGGGRVTIATRVVELSEAEPREDHVVAAGRYVVLQVSDTGVGMSEETARHVFEPFYTTKERGKGTGLGLSTVYGIVKQSGGWIKFESSLGKGTTFTIHLPSADGEPEADAAAAHARRELHGHETLLLVEDQPELRKLTATVLRRYGYVVLEAANGEEAMRVCERHPRPIHLLVTDVVMPKMTGPELADHLTALRPAMRVLFASGYPDALVTPDELVSRKAGYLAKPFTPDGLATKVRDVLGEPRGLPNILVVSKAAPVRSMARRVFKGTGYEVFEAATAKAAASFVRNCQVDLVVADLEMDAASVELLGGLRRSYPELKMVALIPGGAGESASHAEGAELVLRKPIRPDDLLRAAQRLIQGA